MSVYGNIIREHDEIMYMYNMFQHESVNDLIFESINADDILVESVSFEQIKEGAKKLLRALIEKASKIIKWIGEKFTNIINLIRKKFNEILNKNKKPLDDQVKEAEKAAKEESKEEPKKEEKPKKEIPFEELQAFLDEKTRINTDDYKKIIDIADYYLKKDILGNINTQYRGKFVDGEKSSFKDFISRMFNDDVPYEWNYKRYGGLIVEDGKGMSRRNLIDYKGIEKAIKAIDNYLTMNVGAEKKRLEHNIAVYKQKIAEIDNMANKQVDVSQFNSIDDLVSYGDKTSETQRKNYEWCMKKIEKDLSYVVDVFNVLGEYYSALVSEYGKIQNFLN